MDGNFSEKLKTVLSDPDAMATITRLAQNFAGQGGGEPPPPKEENREKEKDAGTGIIGELMGQPAIASALRFLGEGSRERVALLQAMRPFVKDEKKEKLDRIIQTMKMLDLLVSAQKLL